MNSFFYPVDFISDTDYAHAVARVRVLQKKLMDQNALVSMVQSGDENDVFRTLETADYVLPAERKISEYSSIIDLNTEYILESVEKLLPPSGANLKTYFRIGQDFINIKEKAKFEAGGEDGTMSLVKGGTFSSEVLEAGPLAEILPSLPNVYRDLCGRYVDARAAGRISGFAEIDLFFDREKLAALLLIAEQTKSPFLTGFTRVRIDCFNIEVLFRLFKRGEQSPEAAKRIFSDQGTISMSRLLQCLRDGVDSIAGNLSSTAYGKYVSAAASSLRETGDISVVDRELSRLQFDYLVNARYSPFGPEPLVAFYFARMKELKNIKIVFLARKNGISADTVKERLDVYYG